MEHVIPIPEEKLKNLPYPLTIHLLLTGKCNLSCSICSSRSEDELPLAKVFKWLDEWKEKGVKSIAIGGGEPLLYEDIGLVLRRAKPMYVAITTNGLVKDSILQTNETKPDRVAVSIDEYHKQAFSLSSSLYHKMLTWKKLGIDVGINHIITTKRALEKVLSLNPNFLVLLAPKFPDKFVPEDPALKRMVPLVGSKRDIDRMRRMIKQIKHVAKGDKPIQIMLDACLATAFSQDEKGYLLPCKQGITSMSIDPRGYASRCSHGGQKVKYENLEQAWSFVKSQTVLGY